MNYVVWVRSLVLSFWSIFYTVQLACFFWDVPFSPSLLTRSVIALDNYLI